MVNAVGRPGATSRILHGELDVLRHRMAIVLLCLIPMGMSSRDAIAQTVLDTGLLTTKNAGSEVNLRAQPSTSSTILGVGRTGDRLEILEKKQGTDGVSWYFVRKAAPTPKLEGWVRGDLVKLDNNPSAGSSSNSPGRPTVAVFPDTVLQTCGDRLKAEYANLPAATMQLSPDVRLTDGTYVVRWVVRQHDNTNITGMCTVDGQGKFIGLVQNQPMTLTPELDARRKALSQQFTTLAIGKNILYVKQDLQRKGYSPTDNGRGRVTLNVDRGQGQFVVTFDYKMSDYVVTEVVVTSVLR